MTSNNTICVDLNGTLDLYQGWRGPSYWYRPRPGAGRFLAALKSRGFSVVIFTTREVPGVWAWLKRYRLARYVDDVTNLKIPAFAYVDDRAIPFRGNYDAVLRELEHFHPYWEELAASSPGEAASSDRAAPSRGTE